MKQTFHEELTEAFTGEGCALCRLGARTVVRYLDILAYENVNDVALRATIREGLGLCNAHAWQFLDETRAPLGTAIIYRDLIRTLQQRTARPLNLNDPPSRRLAGLGPRRGCVACAALATSIHDCAHQIQRSWADSTFRTTYAASDGLCWPHLRATLDADRFDHRSHKILGVQLAGWERRISRALRQQTTAPLLEALAAGPRLNGTRIEALAGKPIEVPTSDAPLPMVAEGWCPMCAAVEQWTFPLSPGERGVGGEGAGLPCAVHAWRPRPAPSGDDLNALADRLRVLGEWLATEVGVDGTGTKLWRVAERIRRGSALPPDDFEGLRCPICPAQLGYEAGLISGMTDATLCVPHLRVAARYARTFDGIRATTRRTWRTIELQLDEVIRKYDYRFQREPRGEEQASPRWAVALVAGAEAMR